MMRMVSKNLGHKKTPRGWKRVDWTDKKGKVQVTRVPKDALTTTIIGIHRSGGIVRSAT